MITINDVWVTTKVNDNINKNVTLDICYTNDGDDDNINIYDIVLAIARPKIDCVKKTSAVNVLCGLNQFVSDNGLKVNSFIDVIDVAANCAKVKGLDLAEYLCGYPNKD